MRFSILSNVASFSLRVLLLITAWFSILLLHPVDAAEASFESNRAPAATLSGTNTALTNGPAVAVDTEALLRSVIVLQEQLRTMQQEVQHVRTSADTEARNAAEVVEGRLRALEQQQIAAIQNTNRNTVLIVSIAAVLTLLAVLVSGWLQVRAAVRMGEVSRHLAALPALTGPAAFAQLGNGHGAASPVVLASSDKMLKGLDGLQQTVEELAATANGNGSMRSTEPLNASGAQVATIVSKGQALLNLDQAEQALACFEEAIALDVRNVEAWIKKGAALERLQRFDDAVAAYDRAIEADDTTATAHLFKAGVFNRQKRYAEALQCYERALSLQNERRRAGTVEAANAARQ